MKVLVTGGAGYIGSHIVNKLVKKNYSVAVFDNLSTGFREAIHPSAKFYSGDMRSLEDLLLAFKDFQPDAIIHMAAKLSVPESIEKPLDYFDVNTFGMINLLKASEITSIKKIIFSSTAAVYGDTSLNGMYSEESPIKPINPYGLSKRIAEQILLESENKIGIKSVILRYFNVSGASVEGNNGQRQIGATQLIKKVSEAACGFIEEINIFGDDYNTIDGTCVRDYIHVDDLADIHIEAIKLLSKEMGHSEIINCGYGKGYSVNEIINAMQAVSNVQLKVNIKERRLGDTEITIADNSKLRRLFPDWKPMYDDVEIICKSAFNWQRKLLK